MNNLRNLIIVGLLLSAAISFGQRKPDREKIKSLKIAFITERLDLSSNEAEAFWPIYNGHEKKLAELRKRERNQIHHKRVPVDSLNEKQAANRLNEILELEQLKNDERIGFIKEVSTVLSAKKTLLLIESEEEFKKKLIRQYRKRNGGGRR